ncbi:hypothetical protein H0H93_010398 [Arthromyces matolae]|nr:hypothetical protein H0H93_010398 [Arthromyces matolae]
MTFWSSHTETSENNTLAQWVEHVDMSSLKSGPVKNEAGIPTVPSSTIVDRLPILVNATTRSSQGRRSKVQQRTRMGALWARFKRRLGTEKAPSTSSPKDGSIAESHVIEMVDVEVQDDNDRVDEVIVDRVWSEDITNSTTQSDHGASPEKSGGSHAGRSSNDHESMHGADVVWDVRSLGVLLRWRIWPAVVKFFSSSFADPKSEASYAQENWFIKKSLASWASVWLILNWVLGCIFSQPIFQAFDQIVYYGLAPALTLPILCVHIREIILTLQR